MITGAHVINGADVSMNEFTVSSADDSV